MGLLAVLCRWEALGGGSPSSCWRYCVSLKACWNATTAIEGGRRSGPMTHLPPVLGTLCVVLRRWRIPACIYTVMLCRLLGFRNRLLHQACAPAGGPTAATR